MSNVPVNCTARWPALVCKRLFPHLADFVLKLVNRYLYFARLCPAGSGLWTSERVQSTTATRIEEEYATIMCQKLRANVILPVTGEGGLAVQDSKVASQRIGLQRAEGLLVRNKCDGVGRKGAQEARRKASVQSRHTLCREDLAEAVRDAGILPPIKALHLKLGLDLQRNNTQGSQAQPPALRVFCPPYDAGCRGAGRADPHARKLRAPR